MEKITLNEYLKQGSVVENLKNFVGVTPENTVGLMTPERLAAVAGESIGYATPNKAGLVPPCYAVCGFHNSKVKTVLIEKTDSTEWRTISFYLNVSREGSSDTLYYVSGVSSRSTNTVKIKKVFSLGENGLSFYYKKNEDKSISIYCSINSSEFGATMFTKMPNYNGTKVSSHIVSANDVDLALLTKVNVI